jgi:predicted  nucleic acid-binding Zn-ribbon protein
MKSANSSLKPNAIARVDIGAFLPKSTTMDDTIKRNLSGARRSVDQLRKSLDKLSAKLKDLEAEDELDNFEIQDLMSQFNQAETLASNILKKRDDTANSIIGKT